MLALITMQAGLLTELSLLLMGMILGMVLGIFLQRLVPKSRRQVRYTQLSCLATGNVRQTLSAFQQLQVALGDEAAKQDPTLSDLVAYLRRAQRRFGPHASLEGVIQALVVQDLEEQVRRRRALRQLRQVEQVASAEGQVMTV